MQTPRLLGDLVVLGEGVVGQELAVRAVAIALIAVQCVHLVAQAVALRRLGVDDMSLVRDVDDHQQLAVLVIVSVLTSPAAIPWMR